MKITGAKVLNIKTGEFEQKDIYIDGELFVNEPNNEDYIDCTGCYITPGLIDAHSHLGMWEESVGTEGADGNEMTDPVTPHLRSIDGINPFDEAFEEARRGGVTTVCTGPGSTNIVGGKFAIIETAGNVIDDMVISQFAAMKCAFGENPKRYYGATGKFPMTRMAIAAELRKLLNESKSYWLQKQEDPHTPWNEKYESIIPVLEKQVPLKAHVHRADDIATAIRIAKEYDVKLTLDHCTEGHLISEHIANSGFPTIIGPTFGFKTKVELKNKSFITPKVLAEKGIKIALMCDHPVHPQGSLILWAALSAKAGLPVDEAFRSVTINPAEILGISDIKGSISPGKHADLVVWDRHPFDLFAEVNITMIRGNIVYNK
ncbi:amidohydrolase [Guggenheimella bovis]